MNIITRILRKYFEWAYDIFLEPKWYQFPLWLIILGGLFVGFLFLQSSNRKRNKT